VHEVVELVDEYEDVHGWDGTRDAGLQEAACLSRMCGGRLAAPVRFCLGERLLAADHLNPAD